MRRVKAIFMAGVAAFAVQITTCVSVNLFECPGTPAPSNAIDEFVFRRLKKLNLEPAGRCSDAVFVRRAYLDAIGTLPRQKLPKNSC
jgi:hypothetical protein